MTDRRAISPSYLKAKKISKDGQTTRGWWPAAWLRELVASVKLLQENIFYGAHWRRFLQMRRDTVLCWRERWAVLAKLDPQRTNWGWSNDRRSRVPCTLLLLSTFCFVTFEKGRERERERERKRKKIDTERMPQVERNSREKPMIPSVWWSIIERWMVLLARVELLRLLLVVTHCYATNHNHHQHCKSWSARRVTTRTTRK